MQKPFDKHLDECKQCANNPFALCPKGERALNQQVSNSLLELEQKAMGKKVGMKKEKQCDCDEDCNTDPRTLFVCLCPCHNEQEFYEHPAEDRPNPWKWMNRFYRR